MKKTYMIARITAQPDWPALAKAEIDQLMWTPQCDIRAYAQLACGEDRLYVHLHADEANIRAEGTALLDEPCLDSCLEFFFSPVADDARYINIEMNPNCCLYFGIGTGRGDLTRMLLPDNAQALHARCERQSGAWDLYYELPFSLLRLFFPSFRPEGSSHHSPAPAHGHRD